MTWVPRFVTCTCERIRFAVGAVVYSVLAEITKFGVVLLLAYFIALGIFEFWAQVIPEISSPGRLSAAASALIGGRHKSAQTEYPYVVEIPMKDRSTITSPRASEAPSSDKADAPKMSKRNTGDNAEVARPSKVSAARSTTGSMAAKSEVEIKSEPADEDGAAAESEAVEEEEDKK